MDKHATHELILPTWVWGMEYGVWGMGMRHGVWSVG